MIDAKYIYDLYKTYHVPQNVIAHMVKVAKLSEKLCDKFIKRGYKINKNLVIEAALLHDLVRVYGGEGHGEAAYKILKNLNLKKVATLVRKHALKRVDELKNWEEKILYYADKRIEGTKKVWLRTRLRKIRKRALAAGAPLRKMLSIEKKVFKLEREIKNALSQTSHASH